MDIVTYKIAQKYADKVAAGFSSVRVDGLDIIFTLNDGKTATVTVPAPKDSADGQDGNGIISIEETVKEAIENIKQPLVIDATGIFSLSENSTSEEIFNAFGGKEVIENIVKNAYIGNTILGRTYAEWGPPNAFGLNLINIDVSLDYYPYEKFDLDTYPSISIYMSFELHGTKYRIELYFYRNDSNIVVTYFGKYISENVVYLSTSIAGLDKDESTQSEINDALRVSTGDIKTTNYKFITFKFGYYDYGTWYPSYRTGDTNTPVLLDAQIIRDTPDNLYNYKIIVKFIDNDNNILKKLVFTRSNEESDFVISSQEELDLSQIITNKTAIETLQSIIPNTVTSVNGKTGAVELTNTDLNAISTSEKGIANGVATLDVNGLVPSTQLPDYASKESTSNKVTILSSSNTDIQYPSAKTVYDNFVARDEEIGNKVDKEQGKSLISDTEIQRLANVTNYNDTEVKQSITNLNNNKANKNEIPDVSSFITKTVNDLTNYYSKSEIDAALDNYISEIASLVGGNA